LYGRNNFSCELLEWAESKDALNKAETYWIARLDARNPEIGYNIALGGTDGTTKGRHYTVQSKLKMSISKQNKCYVNKNGKISFVDKTVVSQFKANGWQEGLGSVWITKNGENLRVAPGEVTDYTLAGWQIGRRTSRTDQIICIETGKVWPSWKALAEDLSLTVPGILSNYLDKRPYNGLHYCHKQIYDKMSDEARVEFLSTQLTSLKKAVLCVELNLTFNSIAEAASILKLSGSKISLVCNGFRKTHGGYHFKFIKE
jgi:hypothetical protein